MVLFSMLVMCTLFCERLHTFSVKSIIGLNSPQNGLLSINDRCGLLLSGLKNWSDRGDHCHISLSSIVWFLRVALHPFLRQCKKKTSGMMEKRGICPMFRSGFKIVTSFAFLQNQQPVFSKDGNRFFLTVPVKQGGRGEFHHIAMFTTQVRIKFIISLNTWEVVRSLTLIECCCHSFNNTVCVCKSVCSQKWRKLRTAALICHAAVQLLHEVLP